jgi:hypothetical protein
MPTGSLVVKRRPKSEQRPCHQKGKYLPQCEGKGLRILRNAICYQTP